MLNEVRHSACSLSRFARLALVAFAASAVAVPGFYALPVSAAPAADNAAVAEKPVSLADAIAEFNDRAAANLIGRDQPPLTEDEVIAAIRGIDREHGRPRRMSDEVYEALQKIAATRMLPSNAQLEFTNSWITRNGFHITVWWADLVIMTGEKTGYGYRLRDRKVSSRPLTDREREEYKRELDAPAGERS